MAVIVVLVDGVGIAPASEHNAVGMGLPLLAERLGGPLVADEIRSASWRPINATLGVPGLPQSGTGHTAIWGGWNAAAENGRHQPSYPTVAMRARLVEHNLFIAVQALGKRVAWANAYLPGYEEAIATRRLRHTAGTWAALNAGLRLRDVDDLLQGTAVAWDVDQRMARGRPGCETLPVITPQAAGERLTQLAHEHDLVAFETYLPDLAGHGRIPLSPVDALRLVDGLLVGVIDGLRAQDTLVVVSDHGNVEDMTTRIHTRNPVPLITLGAAGFVDVQAIDGVMGAVLSII